MMVFMSLVVDVVGLLCCDSVGQEDSVVFRYWSVVGITDQWRMLKTIYPIYSIGNIWKVPPSPNLLSLTSYVSFVGRLPFSIRVLLESCVRNCDGFQVHPEDVDNILNWEQNQQNNVEIPFKPARVILQDFT